MMEFYASSDRRAKKEHKCDFCNKTIKPGEKYSYEKGKYDGEFFTRKLCNTCTLALSMYLYKYGEDDDCKKVGGVTMLRKIDAMHQRFGKLDGKQCRDCCNFVNGRYHNIMLQKCKVYGMTHSEASDWRQKWTACGQFNKEYTGRCVMETLSKRKEPEPPVELDGQTSLFEV